MSKKKSGLLTAEERAAMKETFNERRRARSGEVDGESDVLAKIAEMPEPDRAMAKGLTTSSRPARRLSLPEPGTGCPLTRRTARSSASSKAGTSSSRGMRRWGFQQAANLDEGDIWPTSYALTRLTAAVEEKIRALV